MPSTKQPPPPSPSDDELDLVLGGGRFVGPIADRTAERLGLGERRAGLGRRVGAAASLSACAALALLWFSPVGARLRRPSSGERTDGFTARGAEDATATLELSCDRGTAAVCPRGGRLTVIATGVQGDPFLGGYAVPASGGDRVWYFTDAAGGVRLGPKRGAARASERAVTLGAEHPTGDLEVHLFLGDHPIGPDEMLSPVRPAGVRLASVLPLKVMAE